MTHRKIVQSGSNVTIFDACGPWYDDDAIPQEIFTKPAQGADLNRKWARTK